MGYIVNTARFIPKTKIVNAELIQFPEKYRRLIEEKAGIKSRYHVTDECTSDLGTGAVNKLLAKTGVDPLRIDALLCATSSPDRLQPATATRIQELTGLKNAFAFDINSVCSGALFALRTADALIKTGLDNVIVVAAEAYSKILNPHDITTYPYFGDGAGAILVSSSGILEIRDFLLYTDGSGADIIQVPAGGTMLPAARVQNEKQFFFHMNGAAVYQFACEKGEQVIKSLMDRNHLVPDMVVTHQANAKIIEEIASRTSLNSKNFYINVNEYANMAAASVVIALDECLEKRGIPKSIFLATFGGGLSWGGCCLIRNN